MSHQSQLDFVSGVRNKFPKNFNDAKVLEVGSLNINGTVRIFFKDCDYLGVDVGAGKDVDLVCPAHELDIPPNTFNTSISCECFEHDKYWVRSFKKMYDLTKYYGLVIFSCATTGRPEHGTTRTSPADAPFTNDYYRNLTAEDFEGAFDLKNMFSEYEFSTNQWPADLYFYGVKK
jgi:SAM-dependent methyltransferase